MAGHPLAADRLELYDGGYDGATVVSVSPAENAVSVVRSSDVSAVFPEAVDAATATGSSFDVDEAGNDGNDLGGFEL